jgi:hypothetical protein
MLIGVKCVPLFPDITPTGLVIVDIDDDDNVDDDNDDDDIYEYSLTAQTHELMTLSRSQTKISVYQNTN